MIVGVVVGGPMGRACDDRDYREEDGRSGLGLSAGWAARGGWVLAGDSLSIPSGMRGGVRLTGVARGEMRVVRKKGGRVGKCADFAGI